MGTNEINMTLMVLNLGDNAQTVGKSERKWDQHGPWCLIQVKNARAVGKNGRKWDQHDHWYSIQEIPH